MTERTAIKPISGSANFDRARVAAKLIALFLACFLVTAVAYHRTNITFFRAESGWYQFLSHEEPQVQRNYVAFFFTHSYHGHFTPFAFAAEFALTRLAGPHENFWKWRQLVALSLVASAIFLLVSAAAKPHRISKPVALAAAAAVTAIFVLQPLMRELVAWPFMVMQMGWMICGTIALLALVRFAADPAEARWIWIAAGSAYASMHCLGLGVITVAATISVLSFFLAGISRGRFPAMTRHCRTLQVALSVLFGLAILHGLAMLRSFGAARGPAGSPGLAGTWPYVLLAILVLAAVLYFVARSALREANPAALTRFVLHVFSIASFVGYVGVIIARHGLEPAWEFRSVLIGARYLVPITFTFLGSAVALAITLARRGGMVAAIFFVLLSCAALAANRHQATRVYPANSPGKIISHDKAWQLILAVAQECQTAGLPIPNVPLGSLTQEFYDWDLRSFEPLLRDQLKLAEPCRFADWADCRGLNRAQYDAAAPSLRRLIRLLGLNDAR